MPLTDWSQFQGYILRLEQEGKVTRTFRRLDAGRQQVILNAILEEAVEKGPASLNIKAIARRANVAVGSLYQYFPNRGGLLDFAIDLCVQYMNGLFTESRPYLQLMPLEDALRAYLTVGVAWGQTESGLVRFFGRAAYQGDPMLAERVVRPIAAAMRELVTDLLVQAAKRGEIRPDVEIEPTARAINATLIALGDSQLLPYLNVYLQVSDEHIAFEPVLEAVVALILRGIAPVDHHPSSP
jgi:AcrR family transcriptional regulator